MSREAKKWGWVGPGVYRDNTGAEREIVATAVLILSGEELVLSPRRSGDKHSADYAAAFRKDFDSVGKDGPNFFFVRPLEEKAP